MISKIVRHRWYARMRRTALGPSAAVIAMAVALLIFTLLALQVRGGHQPSWDRPGMRLLSPRERGPSVGWILTRTESLLGEYRGLWSVPVLAMALLAARGVRATLAFTLLLCATLMTVIAVKPLFDRPPLIDSRTGYFPSTHSAGAMVIGIAVARLAWRTRWQWPVLIASVALVAYYGAALVYTRNHYPSDVVSGWCVAVAWSAAFLLLETGLRHLRTVRLERNGSFTRS